tara:strand:- start:1622 stop:2929 length:1308 start_codon:yes stop_codon:yes gene_type:complete
MFGKENFINKKILIYGLGLSGKSCLKHLRKNNKIEVYDDDISKKNKINKSYFLNKKKIFNYNYDYIVLSPGIDIKNCGLKKYLLKNRPKIITEFDILCSTYPRNKKITITGTNGKSTSCEMLYKIFKLNNLDVRLVGNIGNPPLLEKNIKKKTIFIIEASSYQIYYSNYLKSNYAAILNLDTDHLERHGSINAYAKAKLKLIYNQDRYTHSFIEKNNKLINKYILNKNIKSNVNRLKFNKENFFKRKIKNVYLHDKNNFKNIHFVYAISKKFYISDIKIFKALNKFKGLDFRKQIIYNENNLKIINDSKSTSFSSTSALLDNNENIHWIVGGMYKKGDILKLSKKYYKNIFAYIIGTSKKFFIKQLKNKIKFKYIKNLKKAILIINKKIENDKKLNTILFSPAAASFDQFKNFEERGKYFNKLVKKIILKNKHDL